MNSDLEELLTIKQAAKILHVSPQTLRRWDDKRILKAIRIGTRGDRRYHKKDIEGYISHKKKPR